MWGRAAPHPPPVLQARGRAGASAGDGHRRNPGPRSTPHCPDPVLSGALGLRGDDRRVVGSSHWGFDLAVWTLLPHRTLHPRPRLPGVPARGARRQRNRGLRIANRATGSDEVGEVPSAQVLRGRDRTVCVVRRPRPRDPSPLSTSGPPVSPATLEGVSKTDDTCGPLDALPPSATPSVGGRGTPRGGCPETGVPDFPPFVSGDGSDTPTGEQEEEVQAWKSTGPG